MDGAAVYIIHFLEGDLALLFSWYMAQLEDASGLGPEFCRFESCCTNYQLNKKNEEEVIFMATRKKITVAQPVKMTAAQMRNKIEELEHKIEIYENDT